MIARKAIEDAIEALIGILDALDGDPDAESEDEHDVLDVVELDEAERDGNEAPVERLRITKHLRRAG
jgi:hypothetical protein